MRPPATLPHRPKNANWCVLVWRIADVRQVLRSQDGGVTWIQRKRVVRAPAPHLRPLFRGALHRASLLPVGCLRFEVVPMPATTAKAVQRVLRCLGQNDRVDHPHHPSASQGGSRSLARAPHVPGSAHGRSECHGEGPSTVGTLESAEALAMVASRGSTALRPAPVIEVAALGSASS
jgi:hypothetical protein